MLSAAEIRTLKICRQLIGSLGNTPLRANLDAMIAKHGPDAATREWCATTGTAYEVTDEGRAALAQPHRFTDTDSVDAC